MKQTNIGHHRLHEAEEEAALERLSLFFFLSLSVGKKYTLQEGTFCAVYTHHSVQQQITLYIHRQHHHLPSKGREREIGDLSRARAQRARAAQARLGEIRNKKTSLFFVFVSKTDSYYYYSLKSKPPHGSYRKKSESCNNHRQSKSTPPFLSFYSQAL